MYLTLSQINKAQSQEERLITSRYAENGCGPFLEIEIKQMYLLRVPKSYAVKPWLILVN